MSDSEEEPRRDFREAAATLADMALWIEDVVARPGPNPLNSIRFRLEQCKEDLRRCGFTLVELYHFMYLYLGFSEAEMRVERLKYERAVSIERQRDAFTSVVEPPRVRENPVS